MTYQVFNPFTGSHTLANTAQDAKVLRNEYINTHLQRLGLYQGIHNTNPDPEAKAIANEFIAIKRGIPCVDYTYSVYNASTKEIISRVFECNDGSSRYLVKVANGVVSEWYEGWAVYQDKERYFVSRNINTEEAVEYYEAELDAVCKYSLDGVLLVKTVMSNYDGVPADKKPLLDDFNKKDKITAYSDKDYGFCVEFSESTFTPYSDCTIEQKNSIDTEKAEYIKTQLTNFTVTEEIIHENGDVTWALVDTLTW